MACHAHRRIRFIPHSLGAARLLALCAALGIINEPIDGAIDAVCDVAERIIGKLTQGAAAGGPPLLGATDGNASVERPPTSAMKRFAKSLARQKNIKLPLGYTKSGLICRAFLDQHVPRKSGGESAGELGPKPASRAQLSFAENIAREKGILIPEDAKASSVAMSAWTDANRCKQRGNRRPAANGQNPERQDRPRQRQEAQRR